MQDFKVSIPKPCHEDWNQMTPNQQGRHCNVCVKTVVDFTNMEPKEIKSFFEEKKGEKVCGHFRTNQVERTIPKFYQKLIEFERKIEKSISSPLFRRLALFGVGAIIIISGCNHHKRTTGMVPKFSLNDNYDKLSASLDSPKVEGIKHNVITGDTIIPVKLGEAEYVPDKKVCKPDTSNPTIRGNTEEKTLIMGKVKRK